MKLYHYFSTYLELLNQLLRETIIGQCQVVEYCRNQLQETNLIWSVKGGFFEEVIFEPISKTQVGKSGGGGHMCVGGGEVHLKQRQEYVQRP